MGKSRGKKDAVLYQDGGGTSTAERRQDSGYGEYAGSLDDQIEDVCSAWYAQRIMPMSSVLATYPDFILVRQYGQESAEGVRYSYYDPVTWEDYDSPIRYDPVDLCWKVPYEYDDQYDVVQFGASVAVTLEVVINEIEATNQSYTGEEPDEEDAAVQSSQSYKVPKGVKKAVQRGQKLAEKHGYKMSQATTKIAEALSSSDEVDEKTVRRLVKYYQANAGAERSRGDRKTPPNKAFVQWMHWGGDAGHSAFVKTLDKIERSRSTAQGNDVGLGEDGLPISQSRDVVLVQEFSVVLQNKGKDARGVMTVEGVATVANIVNTKNQAYPKDVWEGTMPHMEELLDQGLLLGECEHPRDGMPTLDRTCFKFTSLQWQGDELYFSALLLPTIPHGQNIQIMVENEIPVNMSSRGLGRTKRMEWMGQKDVDVVQPGFTCDAFDAVVGGASTGSQINSYRTQSAAPDAGQEETELDEETKELLRQMAAGITTLVQANGQGGTAGAPQAGQSTLPQTADVVVQPAATTVEPSPELVQAQQVLSQAQDVMARTTRSLIQSRISTALGEARTAMPPKFYEIYEKHLKRIGEDQSVGTIEAFEAAVQSVDDQMTEFFQAAGVAPRPAGTATAFPHVFVRPSQEERGCKTQDEMIERMVKDLPDESEHDAVWQSVVDEETGREIAVADHVKTPRRQVRKVLQNMARLRVPGGWQGPREMNTLLMLSQGHKDAAEQYLTQTVPDGATAVGAGGAPMTTAFLFPLYVRIFPMLFTNEISSVQPMDKPDGRIFYKRSYRITPGKNWTDENGNVLVDRTPTDLAGGAVDPTYANDPGEFQTSRRIQLRFASRSVTAESKKLHAEASIEEIMDLATYFNLDAMSELMGDLAVEIAEEINAEVLADLVAAAQSVPNNPRVLQYGTGIPAGYDVNTWPRYLGRYISAASNELYKTRNGGMTHIIAGPDAWFALENTLVLGAMSSVAGDPTSPGIYAGLNFTPLADPVFSGVKTFKTNLWSGVNRNVVLILRKGTAWSDTPHVYAPYAQYTSPPLTMPDTMNQLQGYMERAAHVVVASDAIATLTITGATGVPLPFPTAP